MPRDFLRVVWKETDILNSHNEKRRNGGEEGRNTTMAAVVAVQVELEVAKKSERKKNGN